MKKYLLFLILFFSISSQSSTAQTTFEKAFDNGLVDEAYSVKQTADSGYIISGSSFDPVFSVENLYLIKINSTGTVQWGENIFQNINFVGNTALQTPDGGYIIEGTKSGWIGNSSDIYLIRTNQNGDTLWAKTYQTTNIQHYRESGTCIEVTFDSDYIIAGALDDSTNQPLDMLLMKTNSSGDTLWTKTYGGTNRDKAFSIWETKDGGYILAGYTRSFGVDSADVYLVKTNADGDTLWTKAYGGADNDFANSVRQTTDGGYIITGSTHSFGAGGSDVYLLKTDSTGNLLWSKTFGGNTDDVAYSVQQTIDEGYIIAGTSTSFGTNGAYLIKTDNTGNLTWSKAIVGSNLKSVEQTIDGGYISVGTVLTITGLDDFLAVKTNSSGNAGCNEIDPATITGNPATVASGTATQISTCTFQILAIPFINITHPVNDSILCPTIGLNEIEIGSSITISPNPSSGTFTISFATPVNSSSVEIYNNLGERIFCEQVSFVSKKEINLKNISAGIYFVRVNDGTSNFFKKIIIAQD